MSNVCRVILLMLLFLSPLSFGQQDAGDVNVENRARLTPPVGGGAGSDFISTVRRENSSRLQPTEQEPEKFTFEHQTTTRISLPALQITPCQAKAEISYYQRNTQVRVEGKISHDACPVSSGTLDLRVSYYDAEDEIVSLNFTEEWQRDNSQNVEFSRDYEIGEQALLFRVRSSDLRCTCEGL